MATKQEIIDKLSQCGGLSYADWIKLLDSIYFDGDLGDVYEPVKTSVLPTPEGDFSKFSIVGSGTYTQSNGSPITVQNGYLGILNWDGSTWSLSNTVLLPVDPNSVKKNEVIGEVGSNIYNYNQDITGFIISNTGAKSASTNAKMSKISVDPSKLYITFKLDKDPTQNVNKYYSFFDSNDVQIPNSFGLANALANPTEAKTASIPSNAAFVYFTTKNANEVDTIRPNHMVNYGQSALTPVPYGELLLSVAGKSLNEYARKNQTITPQQLNDAIASIDVPEVTTGEISNANLFKSINRHENWLVSSVSNAGISFSSGWTIWFFPISKIELMTISGWNTTRNEIAFFSGTMPATPTTTVNANVVRSGTLAQLGIPTKVGGKTSFTPPAGATWGAVTIKGTTETSSVYDQIQVEFGPQTPYVNGDSAVTIVEKIDSNDLASKYLLDNNGKPLSFDEIKNELTPTANSKFKIVGNGQYLTISYPFLGGTAGHKIWAFRPLSADASNVIDFNEFSFDGAPIHSMADVASPYRIEGTTIGANHGYFKTRITSVGHGKTNVDVGSVWTDGTEQWVIVNVSSADNLDVSARSSNTALLSATTLTHVSGATNTASISATTKASLQMYPAFKDRVVKYFIDGNETTITSTSNLTGNEKIVINESYSILRKSSIMEWFITQVGTSTKIVQVDGLPIVRISISYGFFGDGNVLINTSFLALEDITSFQDIMFVMNSEFIPQTNIKFYVPGTLPFVFNSTNYDFTNPTEIVGTLPTRINFSPARIDNTVAYPSRMVQLGGNWGFAMGYLPVYDADNAVRPTNASTKALQISEIRKTYMSAIDSTSITSALKGQYYSVIGYKSYFKKGNETANYVVEDQDFFLWFLDFHSFGIKIINVPSQIIGRDFEIYDKTNNVTVYSKQLTSEIQLNVANTKNYGYVVLKIVK